ncbi:MAG: hypothetical protein ACLUD0_06905 [Eubacterium ramulus]
MSRSTSWLKKEFDKLMAENAEESDKKDEPETEGSRRRHCQKPLRKKMQKRIPLRKKLHPAQASIEEVLMNGKRQTCTEIAIAS